MLNVADLRLLVPTQVLRGRCYQYMLWMECDSFGVRPQGPNFFQSGIAHFHTDHYNNIMIHIVGFCHGLKYVL